MAVARLVSFFENKPLNPPSAPQHTTSFASRSQLASSAIMSAHEDTFCISIKPYHFSHKRASRQRYYDSSNDSSPTSSPSSSSSRATRHVFRSASPTSSASAPYTPTSTRFNRFRFSQQAHGLRRIPSHVDLAVAAERDERGLDLLEPRPVAADEAAWMGRSVSPPIVLDGIFEVLEGV